MQLRQLALGSRRFHGTAMGNWPMCNSTAVIIIGLRIFLVKDDGCARRGPVPKMLRLKRSEAAGIKWTARQASPGLPKASCLVPNHVAPHTSSLPTYPSLCNLLVIQLHLNIIVRTAYSPVQWCRSGRRLRRSGQLKRFIDGGLKGSGFAVSSQYGCQWGLWRCVCGAQQ